MPSTYVCANDDILDVIDADSKDAENEKALIVDLVSIGNHEAVSDLLKKSQRAQELCNQSNMHGVPCIMLSRDLRMTKYRIRTICANQLGPLIVEQVYTLSNLFY